MADRPPPGSEEQVDKLLQEYESWFQERFKNSLLPFEKAAIKTFLFWTFVRKPAPKEESGS